jgi:hypothetical protein
VPLEPAPLNKIKGEIILNDGRFVTIYNVTVNHVRLSYSNNSSDLDNAIRLVNAATLIDGKPFALNEIASLKMSEFDKIIKALFK